METTPPVILHIIDPQATHCPKGNLFHQLWYAKGLGAGPTVYCSLTVNTSQSSNTKVLPTQVLYLCAFGSHCQECLQFSTLYPGILNISETFLKFCSNITISSLITLPYPHDCESIPS